MIVQYISDSEGKTAGVYIPIEAWRRLVKNYEDWEKGRDYKDKETIIVPEWQIALGRKELELIREDKAGLTGWNEAKKLFSA